MKSALFFLSFALAIGISCNAERKQNGKPASTASADPIKDTLPGILQYTEFRPRRIKNPTFQIPGFEVLDMFSLFKDELIVGIYKQVDGKFVAPDTEDDYGRRLLLIDKHNRILFRSKGDLDLFTFEPHFFKSSSTKTVIVCQEAFEYYCGGAVFMYEKGEMKDLGYLNIESSNPDQRLIDILRIREENGQLIFTFDKDSLLLDPGGEGERLVPNNNVRYIYDEQKLQLHL